jgi:transposase
MNAPLTNNVITENRLTVHLLSTSHPRRLHESWNRISRHYFPPLTPDSNALAVKTAKLKGTMHGKRGKEILD